METIRFTQRAATGLDERWVQAPGAASLLENWRWDGRGGWETVGGWAPILEPAEGGGPRYAGSAVIWSLHWFSRHNGGQQYLLYEDGGNLRVFVGSGTTGWTTLATNRHVSYSPWQHTQYAAWGNWCWIVNGVNQPLRYNGRKLVRAGFDTGPGAPQGWGYAEGFTHTTTSGDFGVGPTGDSADDVFARYRYAASFVNELGVESPLSPLSNSVAWMFIHGTEDGARAMVALQLPSGGDHVVAIRLYRTKNYYYDPETTAQTLYFLRQIDANIEDIWIDAIPDNQLGAEVSKSDFGPWPRGAKYIAFFKSTCFLAGMPEYPDRVVYSRAGQTENFPPDNYFNLGNLDSGEITGMRATKNALIVFKRRGIYIIKGDPATGFSGHTMSEDAGAASPNAFADLPDTGLFFVSEQGVHLLVGAHEQGEEPTRIVTFTDELQDSWRDVNVHALTNACGAFYHRDREYWLAVPRMGQVRPNLIYVYHYDTKSWSTRPDVPVSCFAETRDHRGYLVFGSHDTAAHPGLHVWSQGWPDYHGTAVSKVYESAWLNFGRLYEEVTVLSVILYVVGYAENLTLDYYVDRHIVGERARRVDGSDTRAAQHTNSDYQYPTWNTGTWDDGKKAGKWRPVLVRFDVDAKSVSEFKFKLTATGRAQIIDYDVEITRSGGRNVTPLNTLTAGTVP